MRVGLIGTGFGTRVHMPAMRASSDIEVVAVCSAPRSGAESAAKERDIPFATDDYRELIERDDVDLVNICTPPDSRLRDEQDDPLDLQCTHTCEWRSG